jgi:predicted small lipoprotein YifL
MTVVLRRFVAGSLALLLAACGQTGALYLPDESQQIVIREREAAASPAPSDAPAPPQN